MTPSSTVTDTEIMLKIAGYNSLALEMLYDRYAPILYTLIKKIVSDKETAEEILSEVFVIVWKRIDEFDFRTSNVYTFMIMLARNKSIDELNRRAGKRLKVYNEEYEKEEIIPKLSSETKGMELEEVMRKREKIEKAISSLTEAQRYVIELSYYGGMDEEEISEKLKIPFVTVRSKIGLAMGNLKQKISEIR